MQTHKCFRNSGSSLVSYQTMMGPFNLSPLPDIWISPNCTIGLCKKTHPPYLSNLPKVRTLIPFEQPYSNVHSSFILRSSLAASSQPHKGNHALQSYYPFAITVYTLSSVFVGFGFVFHWRFVQLLKFVNYSIVL
jgi:hypothetical protein